VLQPGQREPACAPGADIATDVPGYRVYRHGEFCDQPATIASLWQPDFVTFLIGCSFSFEAAVAEAGIPLRHIVQQRNVAMFRTNVACTPAGRFSGARGATMRP